MVKSSASNLVISLILLLRIMSCPARSVRIRHFPSKNLHSKENFSSFEISEKYRHSDERKNSTNYRKKKMDFDQTDTSEHPDNSSRPRRLLAGIIPEDENVSVRMERASDNLSHMTGSSRKIRMYVADRYLHIYPDGSVNGSDDDVSDFNILQRTSVQAGQVKIQGFATCMYLCMDSCGLLYSTIVFNDECIFYEMTEQHQYNVYSSVRHSDTTKTLYIALDKKGSPRKVQTKPGQPLGKLASHTKILPEQVEHERIEQVARKLLSTAQPHPHRHRHQQICPPSTHPEITESLKCRFRRKKKKRKCGEDSEESGECPRNKSEKISQKQITMKNKKCEDGDPDDKCQRKKLNIPNKKRKSRDHVETDKKFRSRIKVIGKSSETENNEDENISSQADDSSIADDYPELM